MLYFYGALEMCKISYGIV